MSKILGNFFTTREITALYDPEAVRYFLLTVHYRSELNFEVEVTCPSCEALMDKDGQDPDQWLLKRWDGKAARMGLDIAKVEDLLVKRTTARGDKDWEAADRIRDELTELGVGVQDGPDGSVWSFL